MKFTYKYDIDTEIRRIFFVLEKVKSGFYQENNFLLLPYLVSGNVFTVFLPKISKPLLKRVFSQVGSQLSKYNDSKYQAKEDFPGKKELQDELKSFLLSKAEIDKMKRDWAVVKKDFINIVETIFDIHDYEIELRPTRFGTMSSYLDLDSSKCKLAVYYRIDTDISHLAEMIVAVFLGKLGVAGTKDLWQKREWSVDLLLTKSKLAKLFPGFTPTFDVVNKVHTDNKILQDSWDYYKYLGYPMVNSLTLRGDNVLVNGELKDVSSYPASLQNVLKLFIRSRNLLLTAEQVGDCLWGSDIEKKFSLWAISKQIEGVRNMLQAMGVNPNILETHRKKGYLLRNSSGQ